MPTKVIGWKQIARGSWVGVGVEWVLFYLRCQDQMPTSFSSSSNGSTWPRSLLLLPDGQKCLGASWNFLGRLLNTQARGQEAESLSSHCWIVTLAPGPRDSYPLQMDQSCLCLIGFYYLWRTGIAKRVGPRFCEFCSCSCLPLLPSLASKNHSTWGPLFFGNPCDAVNLCKYVQYVLEGQVIWYRSLLRIQILMELL